MSELDNCEKCGKLFVRTTRLICQDCYKEEEKHFNTVYNFMKKRINREATIPEIVEGTGVEETLIMKFVRDKRLRSSQFPNLTYPCERCGEQIADGKLCDTCTNELSNELKMVEQIKAVEQRNKEQEQSKNKTYFAVDKAKKKN